MERKIALGSDWKTITLVAMRNGVIVPGAATPTAAATRTAVSGVDIFTATINLAGASAGNVQLYWRNEFGDIAAVEAIYIDASGDEDTDPTTAALVADAATAATEATAAHVDAGVAATQATTAATQATTAATQATTAATEIGKVHRSATAVAAGAAMRRTAVADTATTLDETLGPTP